jgi:hypothetical protein
MFKTLAAIAVAVLALSGVSEAEDTACAFVDRQTFQKLDPVVIYDTVSFCYADNLAEPSGIVSDCISKKLSLSQFCANCFVDSASCSVINCFQYCKDGRDSSAYCTSCFNLKCMPGFRKCAFNNTES